MATRFPKPWYRPSRNVWYVTLQGRQINLGADRQLAFQRYHELMRTERRQPVASDDLMAVIDAFLEWCHKHRAAATYHWYLDRLQRFVTSIPDGLTCHQLRPYHVQRWVDSKEGVSNGTRRNDMRAIQRCLRWAEQQGIVDRSPLAHLEKPAAGRREVIVSGSEFAQLLSHSRDQEFRDLLEITWDTGCRPQESLRVEARHVDLNHSRWVFPASESKGKRLPRIIYLNDPAAEITRRLVSQHTDGPLFRNTRGVEWTTDAVNCRFTTLSKKVGKRFCLYHLRHTWMNRLLTSDVDALTVAILAGHSDPSILARTYQHLSQAPRYLLDAVRRPPRIGG